MLFYSNYDKFKFLYVGGSHASTLECLYDCLLDIMFLFCRNKLILILILNPKDTASNLIDNSKENANIINKYFASVFTKEPDGDFISLKDKQTLQQIPLEFSIDEVRKLLQNHKTGKSPGPDGFHPRFINDRTSR